MRVTTRRATSADAPAIAAVVQAAYAPYVERIGQLPAPMLEDYREVVDAAEVWVVERDADVVACLVLLPRDDHLLLDNLAVRPDQQGRGTGAQLLDLADRRARELGLAEIRLYTNVAMTENRAYYPTHGYVETHTATDQGYDRAYFTKRVASR